MSNKKRLPEISGSLSLLPAPSSLFAEIFPFKHPPRVAALHSVERFVRISGMLAQGGLVVFGQLEREQFQRAFFVGMLAALALGTYGDAAGKVDGAHGGFGFVHVLPAFAAGAAGLEFDAFVFRQHGNFR